MFRSPAALAAIAALGLAGCAEIAPKATAPAPAPAPHTLGVVTASNPVAPQPAQVVVAAAPRTTGAIASTAGIVTPATVGAPIPATPVLVAPAGSGARLGKATASLGSAGAGGVWLASPLVKAKGRGRVVDLATGRSVEVELRPGSGPTQLSLAAMTALGLSLTDLPEVEVFAAG